MGAEQEMRIMVVGKGSVCVNMMRSIRKASVEDQVLMISSGEEAVSTYRILEPDLIFMDVIQSGMTGIESARSIREQNRNIKIVLVSEYFNKEFLMAARKMDLNGYLVRTNDSSLLRQVVKDVEVGKFYLFMS